MPPKAQPAKAPPGVLGRTTKSAPPAAPRNTTIESSQPPGGGVRLPPTSSPKNTTSTPTAEPQPAKPKRKPRKLTRAPIEPSSTHPDVLNKEIEVLKTRMRELESQVEALYATTQSNPPNTSSTQPPKLPRRRGRGKGSLLPGSEEKLQNLEGELDAAQSELNALRERQTSQLDNAQALPIQLQPRRKSTPLAPRVAFTEPLDEEEEIPRVTEPAVEQEIGQNRSVTLTGNYRIPLPATVSMDDVRTIQSGISSANRIAREIVDAKRNQRAAEATSAVIKTDGKQSWGDWIGGYSMSLARFVNNIEAEAAVEQAAAAPAKRPGTSRRRSAPGAQATGEQGPRKSDGQLKSALKRPQGAKERSLSQEQVDTLMA